MIRHLLGDCRAVLPTLPDGIAQGCVTSPPYWGLRDYGVDGQIGLEPTPGEYIENLVGVFRDVRRALRDDGRSGSIWAIATPTAAAATTSGRRSRERDAINASRGACACVRARGRSISAESSC
jgi:DNA modification methylase